MTLSYYLSSPFYNLFWHIVRIFRKKKKIILYCEEAFDTILFKNVSKHLQPVKIVAKNRKIKKDIEKLGYKDIELMPSFPDVVVMFRNKAWKFPCKKIVKIGLKHGAFNFKKHSNNKYYNMFNHFFLTSTNEVENVRKQGVITNLSVAYPKVDSLFDNSINEQMLNELKLKIGIDKTKKTLLFTATWDKSGMSAIDRWYNKLGLLTDKYNVIVTVHDWTSKEYINKIKETKNVYFIDEIDRLKYIMLADICIHDTSSIIAECCLINKPMITFIVENTKRSITYMNEYLEKISIRINIFDEIEMAINELEKKQDIFFQYQKEIANIFFDEPDGFSGRRVAEKIIEYMPEIKL